MLALALDESVLALALASFSGGPKRGRLKRKHSHTRGRDRQIFIWTSPLKIPVHEIF